MRAKSRSQVRIDLVSAKSDLATLAGYGSSLGYDLQVSTGEGDWPEVLFIPRSEVFAPDDIARQVLLLAIVEEVAPDAVLERIANNLKAGKVKNTSAVLPRFQATDETLG